jgi:hypothetical protein
MYNWVLFGRSKEEEEKIAQERKEKAMKEKTSGSTTSSSSTKASVLSKVKPGPNKRNRRRKNK